ncbi:MAG: tRNA(Ile)-lysidine synthase [Chloroflexi bacterium]|jgi:tRNA(Ile)-lysidine synthase|nr:MAG: tRNA(Ile)-lysidine synthase [Chloroflexota bacterium]|tara:strand:- start:298 stop:1317 length:1020 start_codon:yes stop_codon:yes gene_type:complete
MNDIYPHNRFSDSFERRLFTKVNVNLKKNEKLLLACSGGPDSTSLLLAMSRIWSNLNIKVAYFNHGTRSKLEHEKEFVFLKKICNILNIEIFKGNNINTKLKKSENFLRISRYDWLRKICSEQGINYLLTAHNLNDQAETLIFRLTRGTSLEGIKSMQIISKLSENHKNNIFLKKDIILFRPLLDVPRWEIEKYLKTLNIDAINDPSNTDNAYSRNYIRQKIIPGLEKINPKAIESIARFAEIANQDNDTLHILAKKFYKKIVVEKRTSVEIDISKLSKLSNSMISRVIILGCHYLKIEINSDQIEHLRVLKDKKDSIYKLSKAEATISKSVITIKQLI